MIFDTRDNVSWWLRVIAVALSIAIVVTGGFMIFWEAYVGRMTYGDGYTSNAGADINNSEITENTDVNVSLDGDEELVVTTTEEPLDEQQNASATIKPSALNDLKANMKNWISTGEAVRDDNVINFLLIGMENNDDRGRPQDLSVNGRADAMMIASVNKRTKTITLASLLRDQYCYIPHNGRGYFTKFHHALSYGGPEKQIEMIERYYKIVIDNYVIVNFSSLPKLIDALGGVDIELTKEEASFLRSNCGWKISSGAQKMHVDGSRALVYMRIRKGNTGGDEGRVGRQQKVIKTLLGQAKNYSTAQMLSAVNAVIPYVRTGLRSDDILAYAYVALSEGWLKYSINQVTLPDSTCSKDYKNPSDGGWYWKVDYPVSAQKLQQALYGTTNIKLDKNRKSWI